MSRKIYEERQAKKFKELLELSCTFLFKDQERADKDESTDSVRFSNYYISAKEGTLPYLPKFGKKGFPLTLNDYNLMNDGVGFYVEAFEKNSRYVAANSIRYDEVRKSVYNTNTQKVDPPYKGNVFELNFYYRMLYVLYNIPFETSRRAGDYAILHYDQRYVTNNINIERFLDIYEDNRKWFIKVMENKALSANSDAQRVFNVWYIVIISIFDYMDEDLNKQFDYDLLDQYDIRNFLYSYGITFLNDLPTVYQLNVIKNLKSLIKAKGTDNIFKIIIEDIFGYGSVNISKYYLVRDNYYSKKDIEDFNSGNITFKDLVDSYENKSELYFLRVPYTVENIGEYIKQNTLSEEDKIKFEDVTGGDRFWDKNTAGESNLKDSYGTKLNYIQTKYLDINNTIDFVPDVAGILLFFSMLHDTRHRLELKYNSIGDSDLDLFGAFAVALYILMKLKDPSEFDSIPPANMVGAEGLGIVLSCLADDKDDDISQTEKCYENGNHESLTMSQLNKNGIKFSYARSTDGFRDDDRLESTTDISGKRYPKFAQHFKNNMEILKALDNALRYTAYNINDSYGYNISNYPDELSGKFPDGKYKGYVFNDLIADINLHKEIANALDKDKDPEYAKTLIESLIINGVDVKEYRNTPGVRALIERANIVINEKLLFEAKQELTNRYGENLDNLREYLKIVYPTAYEKVTNVLDSNNMQDIQNFLANIYSDITWTLANIEVYIPEENGKKSYLSDDVNFKAIMNEYIIDYATKLIEYFKSYTVQIRSNGTVVNLNNPGPNTIQLYDLFEGSVKRHKEIFDYIFTGKNWHPEEISDPFNYKDTDRKGNIKDGVSYEEILDDKLCSINVLANIRTVKDQNYDIRHSFTIEADTSYPIASRKGNYGNHPESIKMTEMLLAHVVKAANVDEFTGTVPDDFTIKQGGTISVVGGPVFVSETEQRTRTEFGPEDEIAVLIIEDGSVLADSDGSAISGYSP